MSQPREWWIVRDPGLDMHTLHPTKPNWDSITLGHERIHVIEKSAYDSLIESLILAKKQRDEFHVELNALKSLFDSATSKVLPGEIDTPDAFLLLLKELKVKYEFLTDEFHDLEHEKDALKAENERLTQICQSGYKLSEVYVDEKEKLRQEADKLANELNWIGAMRVAPRSSWPTLETCHEVANKALTNWQRYLEGE